MAQRPGEDDLIARYFAPLAGPEGLGLLDDAALMTPPAGEDLVLTKDALVAGVHFFPDDPAEAIARKALRVNLSDLAAKGARPLGYLLALALPPDWREDWLADFSEGLGADGRDYNCPLFGGDTVKTPGPLMVSITMLGASRRMARRTGVRAGHALFVTGTIGDSALGLKLRLAGGDAWALGAEEHAFLLDRYLLPRPRVTLHAAMARWASGGMDVSDGFVGDLSKMLRVSGVTATIDMSRLPLSPAARAAIAVDPSLFATAATGGDDYEILASVPAPDAGRFIEDAARAGVAVTRIGEAAAGAAPPRFIDAAGRPLAFGSGSFSHF
jgi:thiamine-monophosphate kinase